jgi:hypothetical protein
MVIPRNSPGSLNGKLIGFFLCRWVVGFLPKVEKNLRPLVLFPSLKGNIEFVLRTALRIVDGGTKSLPKDTDKDVTLRNAQDAVDQPLRDKAISPKLAFQLPSCLTELCCPSLGWRQSCSSTSLTLSSLLSRFYISRDHSLTAFCYMNVLNNQRLFATGANLL